MFIKNAQYILTIFLCIASIALHAYSNLSFVILTAAALLIALTIERPTLSKKSLLALYWIRFGLIGLFHFATKLDWTLMLYLLHAIRSPYSTADVMPRVNLWLNWGLYIVVFFTFHSWKDLYSVMYCTFGGIVFYILFELSTKLTSFEDSNRELSNKNQYLSTHDNLTGLVNFQEFHRQLHFLIESNKKLVLVLIDCNDLKSMNLEQGFQAGNRILKQTAELLKIVFSNAYVISRYGGDEFALAIRYDTANQKNRIDHLLQKELPKLTGMRMTYGMAIYPQDGVTKDDLILIAESNLFDMKREQWLEKEEHFLRTEKLRVVGELASGMAHELRNPLTTIQGFLQLSKSKNYSVEPWYDVMMSEISRMNELTAEFLQFSKPHTTHYKVQDFDKCVNRVIHLMDSESTRTGHRIEYERETPPFPVLMDQDKIVQMLLNIVKNSYESMERSGTVIIKVKKGADQIIVSISDSGLGIDKENLDHIFNPFYTTKDEGTGLGLSICHKIVQDHDGVVEVESEVGKGTLFRITLPLAKEKPRI